MNRGITRKIGTTLIALGFDPRKTVNSIRNFPSYVVDTFEIRRQASRSESPPLICYVPTLSDKHASSGVAKGHYFHQDLWAARLICQQNPKRHIDVGSRIDGFVAHLLCFRDVEVIDIRPLTSKIKGLTFIQADMMRGGDSPNARAESVSCLHALEHFGLGRYGDPLQIDGWRRGLDNLGKMLLPLGTLYISVPVGSPRIEFNAQRIFSPAEIIDEAKELGLTLRDFSMIDDEGDFHESVDPSVATRQDYGCGCFIFTKDAAV